MATLKTLSTQVCQALERQVMETLRRLSNDQALERSGNGNAEQWPRTGNAE